MSVWFAVEAKTYLRGDDAPSAARVVVWSVHPMLALCLLSEMTETSPPAWDQHEKLISGVVSGAHVNIIVSPKLTGPILLVAAIGGTSAPPGGHTHDCASGVAVAEDAAVVMTRFSHWLDARQLSDLHAKSQKMRACGDRWQLATAFVVGHNPSKD